MILLRPENRNSRVAFQPPRPGYFESPNESHAGSANCKLTKQVVVSQWNPGREVARENAFKKPFYIFLMEARSWRYVGSIVPKAQ